MIIYHLLNGMILQVGRGRRWTPRFGFRLGPGPMATEAILRHLFLWNQSRKSPFQSSSLSCPSLCLFFEKKWQAIKWNEKIWTIVGGFFTAHLKKKICDSQNGNLSLSRGWTLKNIWVATSQMMKWCFASFPQHLDVDDQLVMILGLRGGFCRHTFLGFPQMGRAPCFAWSLGLVLKGLPGLPVKN